MQNEDESLKRKNKNKTTETFYKPIKTLTCNTVVSFGWIESNSSEYLRFLELIADYLTNQKYGGKNLMLVLNFLMWKM